MTARNPSTPGKRYLYIGISPRLASPVSGFLLFFSVENYVRDEAAKDAWRSNGMRPTHRSPPASTLPSRLVGRPMGKLSWRP